MNSKSTLVACAMTALSLSVSPSWADNAPAPSPLQLPTPSTDAGNVKTQPATSAPLRGPIGDDQASAKTVPADQASAKTIPAAVDKGSTKTVPTVDKASTKAGPNAVDKASTKAGAAPIDKANAKTDPLRAQEAANAGADLDQAPKGFTSKFPKFKWLRLHKPKNEESEAATQDAKPDSFAKNFKAQGKNAAAKPGTVDAKVGAKAANSAKPAATQPAAGKPKPKGFDEFAEERKKALSGPSPGNDAAKSANSTKEKSKETADDQDSGKKKDSDLSTKYLDGNMATGERKKSDTKTSKKAPVNEPPLDVRKVDPAIYLAKAKRLTAQKKYKEALIEVNNTLKCNKNDWNARYLGAYIYQLEGRNDEAIRRYDDVLETNPQNIQAHINLGVLLRGKGKLEEAEVENRKAIELNFYSLQAHYNLANVLIDQENLEEALKELRDCVKIAPGNAQVHNNLGVLFERRDYYEEAEEEFLRALNLEPANKTFQNNLELIRWRLKKRPTKA